MGNTSNDAAAAKPPVMVRMRRRTALLWLAGAAVAGIVLGSFSAAGSAREAAALRDQVRTLESSVDVLQKTADEQFTLVSDAEDVIVQRDNAKVKLREAEAALAEVRTESDTRQARIVELEAAVQAAQQPAPAPEPAPVQQQQAPAPAQPAPSTNVSYENCTAARNAGAAPVRVGDPGYGRHLDRDGDGIGCE